MESRRAEHLEVVGGAPEVTPQRREGRREESQFRYKHSSAHFSFCGVILPPTLPCRGTGERSRGRRSNSIRRRRGSSLLLPTTSRCTSRRVVEILEVDSGDSGVLALVFARYVQLADNDHPAAG